MSAAAVERVREVRERLCAADLFPVAIGRGEGGVLQRWVRDEGARHTLETGLGFGVATLFICEALLESGSEVSHVAADPYQLTAEPHHRTRFAGAGLQALEDAGVRDLVEFHAEESQVVLPRLLGEGRRFDLAFIDGNHRFEGVFLDLIYAGRLLRPGGVAFVDDTQLPAVRRAVSFCVANLGWSSEDEGTEGDEHEWLVLRTGQREAFARPFREFVDF